MVHDTNKQTYQVVLDKIKEHDATRNTDNPNHTTSKSNANPKTIPYDISLSNNNLFEENLETFTPTHQPMNVLNNIDNSIEATRSLNQNPETSTHDDDYRSVYL